METLATTKEFALDRMMPEDWESVRSIYMEGVATKNATFEQSSPSWEKWDAGHRPFARIVARDPDGIIGWAALSPVSSRVVYAGVAEVSVYVAERARGRGVGSRLLAELIVEAERSGVWTLQSSIFPENDASIALHLRHGFRLIGRRERIAQLDGVWRDTVLLERRSHIVGGRIED